MSTDIYEAGNLRVTQYCGPSHGGTVTDRRRWQITLMGDAERAGFTSLSVAQAGALCMVLRESPENNRG